MSTNKKNDLSKIKLLVMDVDGVLTDGSIVIHSDGSESKCFNSLDGQGIKFWQAAGNMTAFLSGRQSEPTQRRAKGLGVNFCIQNAQIKLPKLRELARKNNLSAENIAYIGDDLPDLPPILYCGFGVAVLNAAEEVKKNCDYITKKPGGSGAVREVVEYILKKTGKWHSVIEQYMNIE